MWKALCRILISVIGLSLPSTPAGAGVGAALSVVSDRAAPASAAAGIRPLPRALLDRREMRCTADGRHCITRARYIPDVCRTVEATADEAGIDPHFFARLLWKESLFDAAAVSPKGAQGIAQFMPGTAALRGLDDAFNPAEALRASAIYLSQLSESFGNIGLAAVAYNGGEARAARFAAGGSGLPHETRDYVEAITGLPAEAWRDAPPDTIDLRLAPEGEFRPLCERQAAGRTLREFVAPLPPWGAVVATNRDRSGAERQAARLINRHAAVLRGEAMRYTHERRPNYRGPMWHAQVGRETREAAEVLCDRLKRSGGHCMVLAN